MTDLTAQIEQGENISVEYNSNKPHGFGLIDPVTFTPFPKNPVIAHFFQQIGRADELGSGMRKLMKYGKIFGGSDPELIEGDVFRIIIKYPDFSVPPSGAQSDVIIQTLNEQSLSAKELTVALKLASKTGSLKRTINDLLDQDLTEYTIPDKPNSRLQKYRLTAKGKHLLTSVKTSQMYAWELHKERERDEGN